MARKATQKSWVRELAFTVTTGALVALIRNSIGLIAKLPDARVVNRPPTASGIRIRAFPFYEAAMECGRQGRYDQAIANYTEALRIDPTFAAALANRGCALVQQNDYRKGIQDFSEAIRLDPTFAQAYLNRAWAYLQLRDFERTIQDCSEALLLDPTLAQGHELRSWACVQKQTADARVGLVRQP